MKSGGRLCRRLVHTKPRAEAWVELNLRRQGYEMPLPLAKTWSGVGALFPRYVFVGVAAAQEERPLNGTRGVRYVVCCGERAARVPGAVVEEIRGRMDTPTWSWRLDDAMPTDPLFARRERERLQALGQLAVTGFRARTA